MPVSANVLLKDYAYYRTGGPCKALYEPQSTAQLVDAVQAIKRASMPLTLLGGGTNSLVMDEPFAGAFIVFRGLQRLSIEGTKVTVGAGVDNTHLAKTLHTAGLIGTAWMNRLPGQMGGTVRMNARCYGGEISQIVTCVTTVTRDGQLKRYTDPSMFKGYKDTIWMANGELIAEAELALATGTPAELAAAAALMHRCESDREAKGQFAYPSCGCVFKNDYSVGVPSGMLLQEAGAMGQRQGGAEVSPHHANFVYNKGATSRDILLLTLKMRADVFQRFGVWLEYEMEMLGTVPADLKSRIEERRPATFKLEELAPLRAKMKPAKA